jgi:ornithine cyclodeaminase/alanine dehydrogenase-like protein (mu-crystallin family)
MTQLRFLSRADVIRCLPMVEAIEGMKSAYAQLSSGDADMPLRARVSGTNDGIALFMPAYLKQTGAMAVKVVSVFPQNSQFNLPIIHALVLVLNAETGEPVALMDGGALTAIRTGAGAGAATDVLARTDAKIVAIIGSGVQARTQLEAVCTVRPIEQVFVYSPTRAHAEQFAADMAGVGKIPANITVTSSADAAIATADIICAATTSTTPVFDGSKVKDGTHINGVGSYRPDMQEVDVTTLLRSRIVVDSREAALEEAGELIIAMHNDTINAAAIYGEIGEIINGTKAGRTHNEKLTYFKSVGIAVQDAAAAAIVLKNAVAQGIGTMLEM